jgi:DNA transformation protein
MSASTEFTAYILDRLQVLGSIETRRFFGGVGLLADATQFAMIMGNTVYFVVNDATRAKYEQAGMSCFSYSTKTKLVQVRRYFALPEEVLEDQDVLQSWAGEAMLAARKIAKPKAVARRPVKRGA